METYKKLLREKMDEVAKECKEIEDSSDAGKDQYEWLENFRYLEGLQYAYGLLVALEEKGEVKKS